MCLCHKKKHLAVLFLMAQPAYENWIARRPMR